MATFYNYDAFGLDGSKSKMYINTGPVVIDEQDRFLLHKSLTKGTWQFTGGRLHDTFSPRANAIYRPAQDLGIEVTLTDGADPFVVYGTIEREGAKAQIVLIHYLATLDTNQEIRGDHKWFTLDEVRDLHKKGETSSPNVLLACEHFLKLKK